MDSRGGYVSKILYVKTKESGPLGGEGRAPGIRQCCRIMESIVSDECIINFVVPKCPMTASQNSDITAKVM